MAMPEPLKEFRFHGVRMQGPCKQLQKAGAKGKHTSNVQRDILSKVDKFDPTQAEGSQTHLLLTCVSFWNLVAMLCATPTNMHDPKISPTFVLTRCQLIG